MSSCRNADLGSRRVAVRHERANDREAVARLHRDAFGADGESVAQLADALRCLITPESGLSLVAEEHGLVVGHVMFTPSLLDAPRQLISVQVLSPVGVLPTHQRQGYGLMLIRAGLEIMEMRRVPVVFLEGSPTYYHRFGFSPGGALGFRRPSLRIPKGGVSSHSALRERGLDDRHACLRRCLLVPRRRRPASGATNAVARCQVRLAHQRDRD